MFDREVAQEIQERLPGYPDEPRLLLVGVGGAGINMLRTVEAGAGLRRVALDTDDYALALSGIEQQLHLRTSPPGGTGGNPKAGRAAAMSHQGEIRELLEGDILFLTAGLGRGTGTGVAPVVAELAQERGLSVLAFLAWPFRREGVAATAREGLAALRAVTDGLLVLDNEGAMELPGIEAQRDAAQLVNEMLGRVLMDLRDRVHGTFPFSVREEMADFLEDLPTGSPSFPVRAMAWSNDKAAEPLSVDPRGVVEIR
ncbi:MAG: hypothetical protein ACE5LS_03155 [Thermoplasmata archaeon]